MEMPRKG